MRPVRFLAAAALLAACGGGVATPGEDPAAGGAEGGLLPRCSDIPTVAPDPADLRDTPVYVGNEQPTEQVQAWASQQPGYAGEVWLDRDANGWVVAGFTEQVEEARAAAAEQFPDDGVVVVEVPWAVDDLRAVQDTVHERAPQVQGSSSNVRRGVVEVFVPRLTDEVHAEVSAALAGDPVCIDGGDPADAPPEGPQPTEGDGWRLLAAEQVGGGAAYRTGIATDGEQLTGLLAKAELAGLDVDVDFATEIVVWFGEPHGSSCPERRIDDVRVTDGDLLHAVLVDPTDPMACTDDIAGAWSFVVAVQRSALPAGPFTIQLADRQPLGDEATRVDADLTRPGATATDDQVSAPEPDPRDGMLRDGGTVEPGFPAEYVMYVHCGAGALGELNDVFWVNEDLRYQELPAAWQDLRNDEEIVVEVLLETGDPPTITASANGHSETYVPGDPLEYGCD